MADDKKNIPDAEKVDNPPQPGKNEPVKADPPVQEQSAPAKTEAPEVEGAPQPGKDEKQTTIPGMGDPAPAGKVVDFTAVREGAAKGKPTEKTAAPDKDKQADKTKDAAKPRRGRPPKADKAAPDKAKPQPRDKMSQAWGAPQSRMTLWGEEEQRSGRISGGNARRSRAEFVTTRGVV